MIHAASFETLVATWHVKCTFPFSCFYLDLSHFKGGFYCETFFSTVVLYTYAWVLYAVLDDVVVGVMYVAFLYSLFLHDTDVA